MQDNSQKTSSRTYPLVWHSRCLSSPCLHEHQQRFRLLLMRHHLTNDRVIRAESGREARLRL